MLSVKKMLINSDFNSSRKFLHDFVSKAAASLPKGAFVLDAGAGSGLYKSLFYEANYESADFCQVDKEYDKVTYVCDLTKIPVEDNRYDMVVLTQVLEHIPEPKSVLCEIYRVLKPNGELWLSAPLFYEEHEIPYDFYRYTQFGFKYLLQSANFKVKEINWLEGYYGTLSYQLKTASKTLPKNPKHYGGGVLGLASSMLILLLKPVFSISSVLFYYWDLQNKYVSSGHCKNYAIVAVK
ncbi:MAG: class I SAM-dependent methyltransferase [Tolypothrix carrinoi HA7290-LM1]|jgi:ubiquinone/menaquinone biosynthesis C-methylase UbiE|nr:class I SAM-dependent methyltransferase [Tolypothrix carrinoi HA7290-LM1]